MFQVVGWASFPATAGTSAFPSATGATGGSTAETAPTSSTVLQRVRAAKGSSTCEPTPQSRQSRRVSQGHNEFNFYLFPDKHVRCIPRGRGGVPVSRRRPSKGEGRVVQERRASPPAQLNRHQREVGDARSNGEWSILKVGYVVVPRL